MVGELGPNSDWSGALENAGTVVHLAGRAHVNGIGSPESYEMCNVQGTSRLAESAADKGIKRFVFISSVKAMGENTTTGPWSETSPCKPADGYGKSKLAAETALKKISDLTGMEIVILRLPLVYGPGVKANMETLMRFVHRGIPLPFGGIENRRSLLGVSNLIDAIRLATEHPLAAGQTFLLSDGNAVSIDELIRAIARAMGKKARLFRVPETFFSLASRALPGLDRKLGKLTGDLVVDSGKFFNMMQWSPPCSFDEGINSMVEAFMFPSVSR